jgi:hypothetical protein
MTSRKMPLNAAQREVLAWVRDGLRDRSLRRLVAPFGGSRAAQPRLARRIELSEDLTNDATVRTLQLASPTVTISVALAYLPDRVEQPTALWPRIANIVHAVAELEADERILVLVAGPAATRQLRTHLPDGVTAAPGTEFTLRIQTAMRNQPNNGQHAVGPDLDILLLDRRELGAHGIVLVSSLTKRRYQARLPMRAGARSQGLGPILTITAISRSHWPLPARLRKQDHPGASRRHAWAPLGLRSRRRAPDHRPLVNWRSLHPHSMSTERVRGGWFQ